MAIFTDCVVVLNVKELPITKKNKLKTAIKSNDGIISYIVNRQCTHVVASDLNTISSCRLKAIQKYHIPVVNLDYIPSCIQEGKLLDVGCYKPCEPTPCTNDDDATEMERNIEIPEEEMQNNGENFRFISAHDSNIPSFPTDFEVAKYSILEKNENGVGAVVVLELQVSQKNAKFPFRISSHFEQNQQQKKKFIFSSIAEKAEEAYDWCMKKLVAQEFTVKINDLSAVRHLTSEKLQQLIIEGALNASRISNEVGAFVEMVWAEAQGHLEDQLINPTSITLNDITKAEGILLQVKKAIDDKIKTETLRDLMSQFYSLLLIKPEADSTITKRKVSEKQDLCQLIRDVVNASEATSWTSVPSSLNKYQALRCQVEHVDPNSDEFLSVKNQLLNTKQSTCSVKILQIFHVARLSETKNFQSQLGNIQQLYHSTSGSNLVGILSRTSIKYSKPNKIDGSCLLVICDVSLGKCKNYYRKDLLLTAAPAEYSSVHGIRKTENIFTEFEDDEFVVYSTSQVKIKYVVQFCIDEDQLKPFHPLINVAPEETNPSILTSADIDIDDLEAAQDPSKNVKSGLQDSAGNEIALQEFHVEAKLMDLVAQVMIFQSYTNPSVFPIEAKYVFPLDDAAAVCGFEAFINGKHIIGQVKEKQQAHHEYQQAIKQGHGAYLMDQASADVFTISIGNLPPNASVIIKITYITELSVDCEYISFLLPGSLTSQQQDKALQEKTQESLKKMDVKQQEPAGGFSLNLSIEMPFEIKEITSPTHNIKIKRTDCTAVISVEENSCLGTGFQLLVLLAEIHAPRMWVENNPEKDSQACMLAFYPEFDMGTLSDCEAIICLDSSFSMRGLALEQAKKVALLLLRYLPTTCRFNIITFGTDYQELFHCSQQRNSEDAVKAAHKFILSVQKPMGNTDFWRPLLSLNLLAPSKRMRNILLISDGHIQNEALTLKTVHQNVKHTRIFTCGVGSTVNRHILRILAQYGGGAHEVFDKNTKFSWKEKVLSQVNRITQPGCSSISVKWEQFSRNAPDPVQAPAQIHSVFNNSRLLIYGFVPHCTRAALSVVINNQEVSTIVSTSELQKTKGKTLHRLTARALIGDYENGSLHTDESEHEMKKSILKSYIIELSKEYSIVTQFTSFVAVEERYKQEDLFLHPSIQELAAKVSVDILSYMDWEEKSEYRGSKLGAPEREMMEEWKVPNKYFPYAMNGDDDNDYDVTLSNILPTTWKECSSTLKRLSASSETSLESSVLLDSLSPSIEFQHTALCTKVKIATDEETDLHLKYLSSDEVPDFSMDYLGLALDASSSEHLSASPIHRSSVSSFTEFSAIDGPNKNKSLFGPEFTAHIPGGAAHFGSEFPTSAAPILENSVIFASGFSAAGSPDISKSLFGSGFAASAAPVPGGSVHFGAEIVPPAAPISASSVCFGSKIASSAAPMSANSVCFGSVLKPLRRKRSLGFYSSMATSTLSDPIVSGNAVSPYWGSHIVGSPCLMTDSPTVKDLVTSESHYFARSVVQAQSLIALPPPPLPCPIALHSSSSIAPDLLEKSERFDSELHIPEISNGFKSGSRSAFQDLIMVNQRVQQSQAEDNCSATTDSDIYDVPRNFKKREKFQDPQAISFQKLKDPEVLSNITTKMHAMDLRCMRRKKAGLFQRKKENIKKALRSKNCEIPWTKVFMWQNMDGYWNFTSDLGVLLEINVEYVTNVFLIKRGIKSLGHRAAEEIVSLIATFLILQLIRFTEQLKGIKLTSLLCLDQTLDSRTSGWQVEQVKKAIAWARNTDRKYPAICSRLQLGRDWESATRQLLKIDSLIKGSPLQQLFNQE
ncbi:protein mono-ADP-ribosyltransferase PARP4 isoform X2 [Mustelus asterias]